MPERTFIEQVTWLRRNFELISMEEVQRRLRSGENTRPGAAHHLRRRLRGQLPGRDSLAGQGTNPLHLLRYGGKHLENRPFEHDLKAGVNLPPNSLDEIRAMAGRRHRNRGAHYCHPDLGKLTDPAALNREIVTARQELQEALGQEIRYFAFPFGQHANLSCRAFELAARSGYEGVCSAYGGYNFPGDDPFHVQRIAAVNELLRMKNWLNADPRKLYTRRFEYHWVDEQVDPFCRKGLRMRRLPGWFSISRRGDVDKSLSARGTYIEDEACSFRGTSCFFRRKRRTEIGGRGPLRVMFVITSMQVGGAETLARRIDPPPGPPPLSAGAVLPQGIRARWGKCWPRRSPFITA